MAGKGIPFLDLVAPHVELQEELMDAVKGVLTTGMFIGGPVLESFEREFADYCGAKHCIGVASGTDALRFALMAAGIGKGDIVVTVPNTFVATVEAILQAGATPHFVDVDTRTFNMSATALREYLETQCHRSDHSGAPVHRTSGGIVKAILPVHLYGQMCDMDELGTIANDYGIDVFEDACQAHGSEYFSTRNNQWQRAGSIGKAAGFSFYPGKNLGACGEAGAVTTNDDAIAKSVRMIRDHGQNKKYHHIIEGYNGRLDAMQAAILKVKLPHLDTCNSKRRKAAALYNTMLETIGGVETPFEPEWSRSVFHLYVVCTSERDVLQKHLTEKKIGTGLHYPVPVHVQPGYAHLGYKAGDFPTTERLSGRILSLPMFPQLTVAAQQEVVDAVVDFNNLQRMEKELRPA